LILLNDFTRRYDMRLRNEKATVAFAVLGILLLGAGLTQAQVMECTPEAFQNLNLKDGTDWVPDMLTGQPVPGTGQPVTIVSATIVPEDTTNNIPEYCDVIGTMLPTIRFEVALPTTMWNGRLLMAGNGGKAGTIPHGTSTGALLDSGAIVPAVKLGYAATGTDTGHCSAYINAAKTNGGCPPGTQLYAGANGSAFAYKDYPTADANPYWYAKMIDFAYLSVHETINVAKQMVQAYYGEPPAYTYWVGCSTGGRQGLMEAQRYPTDFDGILAGSAVNAYMAQQMAGPEQLGPQYSTAGCDLTIQSCGPQIPPANLAYLGQVVYNKCDGIDGLVDGIINDPRKCHLDVDNDLTQCQYPSYSPGTAQPANCFTSAQLAALKQIYAGGFTSTGELVVPGTQTSAEAMSGGWSPWLVANTLGGTTRSSVVGDAFKYLFFPTPQPSFNYLTDWSWDDDPPQSAATGQLFDATNPDLSDFFHHGGKIIMYHGWADVSANPLANTLPYYEDVLDLLPQAKAFFAYYLVPGMGHCGGGAGCGNVDWLTPLINWVENGEQPHTLTGLSTNPLYLSRTRPICRYPQVEKYKGHGDINDAKNFVCVDPHAAGK
jgi:hypothetical protein